jgi:diaminopimelate epimerase
MQEMEPVSFCKMSGSGNDFVVIDNRNQVVDDSRLSDFVRRVCRRKMAVGADGLILIESSVKADFSWRFYNSNGSPAEMCGNGARCAARFAHVNGIAGQDLSFETEAGLIAAQVKEDRVKVKMPDPFDLRLDYTITLKSGSATVSSINTGVPHVVWMKPTIDDINVFELGKEIRHHESFAPAGTNVNFVCQKSQGQLVIRTYERGVEDETLACGTGSIAAALIKACKAKWSSPVSLLTRGGEILTIHFNKEGLRFNDVYLEGDARIIYTATLQQDALKS